MSGRPIPWPAPAPAGRAFVRVVDLETTGSPPPTHRVVEIGWQDVALNPEGRWELAGEGGTILVDPGRPIPPVTMAVHHLRDEDVAGQPWWPDAAAVLGGFQRPLAFAAHRASFEQMFCTPALSLGTPWICTWKCALRLWPDEPGFSNQVLRYSRRPAGLVHERGLPAHRAFPDAYVTAHHLRDQLNEASAAQLLAWSAEPGLLPRVRHGPDRGRSWTELEPEALARLAKDRDTDTRFTAEREQERRAGGGAVGPVTVQSLLL